MWWVVQRWACDPIGANESTTRLFLGMLGKKKIFFLVYLELWGYEGWSCGGHQATVGSLRMKSTHRTEKRERLDALFLIPLYPAGPNDPRTFQLYQIKSSLLLKAAYVCFNVTCTQEPWASWPLLILRSLDIWNVQNLWCWPGQLWRRHSPGLGLSVASPSFSASQDAQSRNLQNLPAQDPCEGKLLGESTALYLGGNARAGCNSHQLKMIKRQSMKPQNCIIKWTEHNYTFENGLLKEIEVNSNSICFGLSIKLKKMQTSWNKNIDEMKRKRDENDSGLEAERN